MELSRRIVLELKYDSSSFDTGCFFAFHSRLLSLRLRLFLLSRLGVRDNVEYVIAASATRICLGRLLLFNIIIWGGLF